MPSTSQLSTPRTGEVVNRGQAARLRRKTATASSLGSAMRSSARVLEGDAADAARRGDLRACQIGRAQGPVGAAARWLGLCARGSYMQGTSTPIRGSRGAGRRQRACARITRIFSLPRRVASACRHATGYLVVDTDNASEHHAWAEAWVEGLGWVGFDVANRIAPPSTMCGLPSASMRDMRPP